MFALKLALIIYVNAGRIVIDYIKPFKIALLEHCKQGAGSIFFKGLYWLHKVNFSSSKLAISEYAYLSPIGPSNQIFGNITNVSNCVLLQKGYIFTEFIQVIILP